MEKERKKKGKEKRLMEIEKKEGFDRKILEKVEMGEMSVEGNV